DGDHDDAVGPPSLYYRRCDQKAIQPKKRRVGNAHLGDSCLETHAEDPPTKHRQERDRYDHRPPYTWFMQQPRRHRLLIWRGVLAVFSQKFYRRAQQVIGSYSTKDL